MNRRPFGVGAAGRGGDWRVVGARRAPHVRLGDPHAGGGGGSVRSFGSVILVGRSIGRSSRTYVFHHSFIHSFIHSLIRSLTHSFIHSFKIIHSKAFIHSFIHSFAASVLFRLDAAGFNSAHDFSLLFLALV